MSINQSYRRVSQVEAQEITDGAPAIIRQWFGPPAEELLTEQDDERNEAWLAQLEQSAQCLDINTTWHAIHFLLNGSSHVEGPLQNVTMGGAETDIETVYGVARYLSAPDVAATAAALEPLTVEAVTPRYDAAAFRAARVYPHDERWEDDDLDEFIGEYEQLRAFFLAAAREDQAMFIDC